MIEYQKEGDGERAYNTEILLGFSCYQFLTDNDLIKSKYISCEDSVKLLNQLILMDRNKKIKKILK